MIDRNDYTDYIEEHGGHTWEWSRLSDSSAYSVRCLDPDMSDDDIDCTNWPDDKVVSGWIGELVEFAHSGDHPTDPEGIYHTKET